jgi:hypothetical protein
MLYEIRENDVMSDVEIALLNALAKLQSGVWTVQQHQLFVQLMDAENLYVEGN